MANITKQKREKMIAFRIVVDMWITGFDVLALTYMYNDKALASYMFRDLV